MIVAPKIEALQKWLHDLPANSQPKVLVPTMGALHEGHLSLIDRAREEAGHHGKVMVTIFVNPTQFGPNEDFSSYPRQLEADLDRCRKRKVDLAFTPDATEMYSSDSSIEIAESSLSNGLCGASRPGHFNGVCTVVGKLFNLTRADKAIFGEKDYQQLAVIRRMVRDLNFPTEVIAGPTVREADGLAMSSRNAYLTKTERQQAPILHQSLTEVRDLILTGKLTTADQALNLLTNKITDSPTAKIDYLNLVDAASLEPLQQISPNTRFRLIAAVFFGKTRLIDNIG